MNFEWDPQLVTVRTLGANLRGRDFVCSDPHGQADLFRDLLGSVGFDRALDRVFLVGDLVDRGPGSAELLRIAAEEPWAESVMGNHETFLLEAAAVGFQGEDAKGWLAGDGRWAIFSDRDELQGLAKMASELPSVITVGDGADKFHVLHAEFVTMEDEPADDHSVVNAHGRRDPDMADRIRWGRSLRRMHPERAASFQGRDLSRIFCGHSRTRHPGSVHGRQCFLDQSSWLADGGLVLAEPAENRWTLLSVSGRALQGRIDWDGCEPDDDPAEAPARRLLW